MPRANLPDLESRMVYERAGVLVVDKPAGLATSGRDLDDPECLQYHLIARAGRMVWAVHQLDADTSGLNVFVSKKSLVPVWAERLRWPVGRKTYAAVCHGEPGFEETLVNAPIGELSRNRLGVTAAGRPASSAVRTVSRGGGFGLVLVELHTGRTHQVRIHLAHLGHPLVGEPFYRDPPCELLARHALHSLRLELDGDEPLCLRAPLPEDLVRLCEELGLATAGLEA